MPPRNEGKAKEMRTIKRWLYQTKSGRKIQSKEISRSVTREESTQNS